MLPPPSVYPPGVAPASAAVYIHHMLDPRTPRVVTTKAYRANMREWNASLVAEGPILVGTASDPVALVVAPPQETREAPAKLPPSVVALLSVLDGETPLDVVREKMRAECGYAPASVPEVVRRAARLGVVTVTRPNRTRSETWTVRRG